MEIKTYFPFLSLFLLMVFLAIPSLARADYYYYYSLPDPFFVCATCYRVHTVNHKHKKSYTVRKHRSNGRSFSVTKVFYPACGAFGCGGGYLVGPAVYVPVHMTHDYVTFMPGKTHSSGLEYPPFNTETYDMRTADDNVCADPDMNNQY